MGLKVNTGACVWSVFGPAQDTQSIRLDYDRCNCFLFSNTQRDVLYWEVATSGEKNGHNDGYVGRRSRYRPLRDQTWSSRCYKYVAALKHHAEDRVAPVSWYAYSSYRPPCIHVCCCECFCMWMLLRLLLQVSVISWVANCYVPKHGGMLL